MLYQTAGDNFWYKTFWRIPKLPEPWKIMSSGRTISYSIAKTPWWNYQEFYKRRRYGRWGPDVQRRTTTTLDTVELRLGQVLRDCFTSRSRWQDDWISIFVEYSVKKILGRLQKISTFHRKTQKLLATLGCFRFRLESGLIISSNEQANFKLYQIHQRNSGSAVILGPPKFILRQMSNTLAETTGRLDFICMEGEAEGQIRFALSWLDLLNWISVLIEYLMQRVLKSFSGISLLSKEESLAPTWSTWLS